MIEIPEESIKKFKNMADEVVDLMNKYEDVKTQFRLQILVQIVVDNLLENGITKKGFLKGASMIWDEEEKEYNNKSEG